MNTIFAPITASSKAGVGIIRISGKKTVECLRKIGFRKNLSHQKIYYHKAIDPQNHEILDEVLIAFFSNPQSLTGEDVAEINIHASPFILKRFLQIFSEIKDVRFAEPGEFLKRAFLNGKIDLVQAEAVPDLIVAETEIQHQQAIRQLQGRLGEIYEKWRYDLISILARIEAFIDFPDEDLPQHLIDQVNFDVEKLSKEINQHLDDRNLGQKIKEGLSLAIIGAPNAGKSSLINFLAKSEIAIVSEIAGTTRDIVETHLSIAGFAVKIADTAGLRDSTDLIEREGIKRALKKAQNADLKIFMIDAANPVIRKQDEELIDDNTILVINKIELRDYEYQGKKAVKISLKNNVNLAELLHQLEGRVSEMAPQINSPLITQERYRVALKEALEYLRYFSLQKNIELAAEDLRMASRQIGKITGKIDIENLLDVIFSSFCIGK